MKNKTLLLLLLVVASTGLLQAQNTQIRGFANVDAWVNNDTGGTYPHFGLGQYDWFITSQVNDKISFLGESVFEYDGGFLVDVERIIINYDLNDHFRFSIGKFHTPLGYWNNAYHHGMVIQPTTVRPYPIRFEDEGGILPIHETGAMFTADNFTKFNLGINVLLSNGLAGTPVFDNDIRKAATVNIHAEPCENLHIIVSDYMDMFPGGNVNPQLNTVIDSTNINIMNASVAYMNNGKKFEALAEYYQVQLGDAGKNNLDSLGSRSTTAYVVYAGYKIKEQWVPYVSYESTTFPKNETYFTKEDQSSIIVGLRYHITPLSVIKFEVKHIEFETLAAMNHITLQFAIGF